MIFQNIAEKLPRTQKCERHLSSTLVSIFLQSSVMLLLSVRLRAESPARPLVNVCQHWHSWLFQSCFYALFLKTKANTFLSSGKLLRNNLKNYLYTSTQVRLMYHITDFREVRSRTSLSNVHKVAQMLKNCLLLFLRQNEAFALIQEKSW